MKCCVVALFLLPLTRHCIPKPEHGYELSVKINDDFRKLCGSAERQCDEEAKKR